MFSMVKRFSIFNRNTLSLFSQRIYFDRTRSLSDVSTMYNEELEQKEITQNNNQKDVITPALYAFAARMHLDFSDPKILLQAVTHKSFTDTNLPSNKSFKELGNCAIQLYLTEYFHIKYPLLHTNYLKDVVEVYNGRSTLATLGHEIGLNYVVRWNKSTDVFSTPENDGQSESTDTNESQVAYKSRKVTYTIGRVVAQAVQAIVGALYLDKGPNSAQTFVHDHLLSREFAIQKLYDVKEPKRHLSALMKRLERDQPISRHLYIPYIVRLLHEAGRKTKEPIFVIGTYSGTEKLAEGFGSSIKMAEHRAAKNALLNHYFKEIKDFTLPSTIDTYQKQMSYIPTKVGDTPAKI
ncbi:15499_t:CDS:2 [Funneliformis caledonium]|uniref:Large ribosomal subunit protein mL44 n=1 Tax=Funneliformis caledonium TaxID=1117310 RepID=A0A9N9BCV5_9GLOM|nr:15499_t:CDS:2 [Funneliformis caledonium]